MNLFDPNKKETMSNAIELNSNKFGGVTLTAVSPNASNVFQMPGLMCLMRCFNLFHIAVWTKKRDMVQLIEISVDNEIELWTINRYGQWLRTVFLPTSSVYWPSHLPVLIHRDQGPNIPTQLLTSGQCTLALGLWSQKKIETIVFFFQQNVEGAQWRRKQCNVTCIFVTKDILIAQES